MKCPLEWKADLEQSILVNWIKKFPEGYQLMFDIWNRSVDTMLKSFDYTNQNEDTSVILCCKLDLFLINSICQLDVTLKKAKPKIKTLFSVQGHQASHPENPLKNIKYNRKEANYKCCCQRKRMNLGAIRFAFKKVAHKW